MVDRKEISVKGVDGLETILDFDPTNGHFLALVGVSSLAKNIKHNTALKNVMKFSFKNFFAPYIRSLGFKILEETNNPQKIILWEENEEGYTRANVSCETTEILSNDKGDRKFGYQPNFEFRLTPDIITVKGYLRRTGGWGLEILDDLLTHFNLCGDGIARPQVGFGRGSDGYDRISIASVEHMPKVLAKLQELYGLVEGQKLQDLLTVRKGIEKLEIDSFHQEKPTAADILRQEYQKRKELILPANRDF